MSVDARAVAPSSRSAASRPDDRRLHGSGIVPATAELLIDAEADPANIHQNSVLSPVPSLPAVRVFDDRFPHYDPTNPLGSVIHPNTGTQVRILSINTGGFMQLEVRPAK